MSIAGRASADGPRHAVRPRLSPAVARIRGRVRDAVADLAPDALVLVASSGGPDSLALAAAAAFVAPRRGLRCGAVTVDHGLQPDAAHHAERTAATLRELGLDPVEVLTVTVNGPGGTEAAARRARYTAIDDAARRLGAGRVLLGHTMDDQAETVLLGLARGSGARSLAGMPAASGIYGRPLLALPRQCTLEACAALGLSPWHDPHNRDPRFTRVRVRTSVLPVLERELGPGVAEALARTAAQLRDDADALDEWAGRAIEALRRPDGGLDIASLAELPRAVRTRVIRAAALAAGSPPSDMVARHVAAVDALITDWHGQRHVELPGGVVARRSGRPPALFLAPPRG